MLKNCFIYFLLGIVTLAGCSKSDSDDLTQSVPSGTYKFVPAICVSSEMPPDFQSANMKATLLHFEAETKELEITGNEGIFKISDDTCALSITQEISVNANGYFAFKEKRTVASEPEGCTISINFDETTFPFGSESPVLTSGESSANELLLEVSSNDTGYELISRAENPDQQVWHAFGCAKSDQIKMTLEN